MSDRVKIENLKGLIIEIKGHDVLLDSDVAQIYGVETKDINKAVANNPDKFPAGYIVALSKQEKTELVENFHRFEKLKHSTVNPKAFTEKGLYIACYDTKKPLLLSHNVGLRFANPTFNAALTVGISPGQRATLH
jgi:hypothetical protein